MSILNTENYSLKERKKIRRQDPSMSIKDWLKDLSTEPGHSQMILKSEMSRWKMDFLPLSWVR